MAFVIAIHVLVCVFLIIIILVQAGRGGGLIDNLSSMESVLGTKTNAFLTKTTSVLAVLFFLTCLTLAFLSLKQSRSLVRGLKVKPAKTTATALPSGKETATANQQPAVVAVTTPKANDTVPQNSAEPQKSTTQQNTPSGTSGVPQPNTASQK